MRISPAPHPYPPLNHYLSFCHIPESDYATRGVIEKLGIDEFDEFLSEDNSLSFLKSEGMKHGPAARLTGRAAAYRDQLKTQTVNQAV